MKISLFLWLAWFVLVVVTLVLGVRELIRDKKQHAQIGTAWTRVEELLFYWLGTAQLLCIFCLSLYGSTFSPGAVGGFTAQKLLMAVIMTVFMPPNTAVIVMIIAARMGRREEKNAAPAEPFKFTAGMKLVCAALVIIIVAATLAYRYGALSAGTALVIMLLSTVIAQGVFLVLLRKKQKHPAEREDNKDEVRKLRETNDESEGTQ